MSRKARRRTKPEEYVYLAVRVERYEASVGACINHNVYAPQNALRADDNDPLYEFTTRLEITGTATYPESRAGDTYELTIYGEDAPSSRLNATLRDAQARDSRGAPQYRQYRGRQIPVYKPPKGVGLLEKVRGEPRWTAWLFAAPRFLSDMLALLGHDKPLYVAIHERKEMRSRWVQSLALQTSDPAAE